ncbi:hypothetical protein [Candidatus Electronema sp. PJ]|uniref:hypothetical protein n=1 Tax=Candidatus Electronema sp. PJ TaxID=3401572 RepID=UPI003AA97146
MSRRKHLAPEQKHDKREQPGMIFSFQLSLSGIVGIGVVLLCLFLWMFLLGIWAGQTFLYPPRLPAQPPGKSKEASHPTEAVNLPPKPEALPEAEGVLLLPGERKKRIAPQEPAAAAAAE